MRVFGRLPRERSAKDLIWPWQALALAVDAYVAAIEARFAVAQEDIP